MDFTMIDSRATKCVFLILMILFCPVMVGWADNWEDIQKESARIKSVSAHFSQEKHLQILTKPLVSKGRFYFQAPDSIRWEYTSPVKSVLLMHKGNIKRYAMGSKGIVEESGGTVEAMQIVLQEISLWSKGQFTGSKHFSATIKGAKGPQIILMPKEKGLSAMISRIVINLSADRPGVMKSVKIVENEGNYTLFEFIDVQINVNISETLFREVG